MPEHKDRTDEAGGQPGPYSPPRIVVLGHLTELTSQIKEVGAFDGTTFLGTQLGS
jgi:hypothetical protein